jgi:diacylglycerol O-acyltransferase
VRRGGSGREGARADCDRGHRALSRPVSLSPADLSAVQAEQGPVHMHVGGVLVLGGRVAATTVIRRIEERIHLIPHYRMRLVESAPGGLVNPVWEDDPRFDVTAHVSAVPWPEPGGDAELCRVMGKAMSTRLDRSRPLWEIVVVDSPTRGCTALVVKMHHALVDGIAAIGVGTIIFDPTPEPLELPPPTGAPEQRQRIWVDELSRLMPQLRGERRLELIEPLMRRVARGASSGRARSTRVRCTGGSETGSNSSATSRACAPPPRRPG